MSKPHRTCEGYIDDHYYTHKTSFRFDWAHGHYMVRTLTRSFDTLEAAQRFANGKDVNDIFRRKGKYVVEWFKTIYENERGVENDKG